MFLAPPFLTKHKFLLEQNSKLGSPSVSASLIYDYHMPIFVAKLAKQIHDSLAKTVVVDALNKLLSLNCSCYDRLGNIYNLWGVCMVDRNENE